MSKAKELRDKFNLDLKVLQQDCKHEKTDIQDLLIGIDKDGKSHKAGKVKVCLECWLFLEQYPPDGQYELMLQA